MTLTKIEKETIILFNEGKQEASIYTFNASLRKRLALFSKQHPELCRMERSFDQGGVSYVLDKSRLSIHLIVPYSAKNAVRRPVSRVRNMEFEERDNNQNVLTKCPSGYCFRNVFC